MILQILISLLRNKRIQIFTLKSVAGKTLLKFPVMGLPVNYRTLRQEDDTS